MLQCVTLLGTAWGQRCHVTPDCFVTASSRLHEKGRAALVLWRAPLVLPKHRSCGSRALRETRVGAEMEMHQRASGLSQEIQPFLLQCPLRVRRGRTNYLLCLCSVALVSSPLALTPSISNTCPAPSLKSLWCQEHKLILSSPLSLHHCSASPSKKISISHYSVS